jgi:ABC-type transport system substrate-binding protein
LVAGYVESKRYPPARKLIRSLADLFPNHPVIEEWQSKWKKESEAILADANKAIGESRFREADRILRELVRVWPNQPGAKEAMEILHRRYPRVVVGIIQPAAVQEAGRMHDWASRRAGRLVRRTLMELLGAGTDGGIYNCPFGKVETQELGLRLAFQLDPGHRWSRGDATLTGCDLGRRLFALADPEDPAYRGLWQELLREVSVEDVYTVYADLNRPHVRPEALLQTRLIPYTDPNLLSDAHLSNGPFAVDAQEDGKVIYVANQQYFASESGQLKELTELYFEDGLDAIRALEYRDVDVIDRVNPWEHLALRSIPDAVVQRYALPLVHCLVPNRKRPLTARRSFRRALVYGIHRQSILEHLLGEEDRAGCQLVSGPFSPGMSFDDPLNYAYDKTIQPRPYNPRLAVALIGVVLQELAEAGEDEEQQKEPAQEITTDLVLAHPPHQIARLACKSIKQSLELLELSVELRELPAGSGPIIPEDVDLMYAELAMWEPVVDARVLLDSDGMSRGASPYMSLALRQLERSTNWGEVADKLREIHQIAFADVAVIPLWQLTDHYAYHGGVRGIEPNPVSLYQDVERWRLQFQFPSQRP